MGSDHRIAEKCVIFIGSLIKDAAGVFDQLGGGMGDGRAGSDEFGEEIDVGFEGVSEHESMDLEKRGCCSVALLEKV